MARNGTSTAMQQQISIMNSQGKSLRSIAKALGLSRNAVRAFLRAAVETQSADVSEAVVDAAARETWATAVDWERVCLVRKAGRTIKQLHVDHSPGVSYWAFRRALNQRLSKSPKAAPYRA